MKYKLTVEYDGTRFRGWQAQKGLRTVQGELIDICQTIFKTTKLEVYGAGRTDAGVHAIAQVAHLAVDSTLTTDEVGLLLNERLPEDISIVEVAQVPDSFHARHDAIARSYLYRIAQRANAEDPRYAWYVRDRLDLAKMREAAAVLVGMHDFRSFSDDDPTEKSTKVELLKFDITKEGDLLDLRVVGSHFLWKMVRRMVGVLVEVGRGRMTALDVRELLKNPSRRPAEYTAPPAGLFLDNVYYDEADIE